jgi:hypothetical protein
MDAGNGIETSTPHLLLPQVAVAPSQNELRRSASAPKLWALLLLIGLLHKGPAPCPGRFLVCTFYLQTSSFIERTQGDSNP